MDIFTKACDSATVESNVSQVNLGVILKKVSKYINIMNR